MAYIRAVQNGNYSSPSTWEGGIVPGAGDYACTLTYRIVLDIDVSANLCVNQTDWVTAGGTTTASFQGGFDVPDGVTRVISGDLRYDNSSNSTTNSLTTSALTLKSGHLTLNKVVYVPGYLTAVSSGKGVIYFSPTSASNASLTITTSIDVSRGSTSLNSGYYGTTIIVIGITSGMVTLNIPEFNMLSGTSDTWMSSVLYMTGGTGYTINMNGNFFNGSSQLNNGIMYINTPSTGIDNQIININTASIGAGALKNGYGIYVTNISTMNFMPNTVMNCPSATSYAPLFTLGGVRNSINIPGTLTSSGYGVFDITLSGGTLNCGNIVQTVNGNTLLTTTGSGNVVIGDITTSGTSSLNDSNHMVKIGSVGTITIGNIYFPVGALYHKNILAITSARTSPTVIGSIDCTNQYVRAGSAVVDISGSNTSSTTVNGNIIGPIYGSVTNLNAAALYLSTTSVNQGQFTINGNVKAGIRGPGLQLVAGSQHNVTINGTVIGADYPGGATIIPAAVQSGGRRVLLRDIDTGIDGKHPIDGLFAFIDPAVAYYKGIDSTGAIVTLNTQINAIPAASDVRSGVSTGVTTGTLVVPQASTVLDGVVFDNGTTGTLDVFNGPNYVTETRTASQNGYWTDTATWGGESIPTVNSFVYTNGKQVIVDGTVNCAGLADTTETGGLILNADGNAALLDAYGDSTFSDTYVIAEFDGNLLNVASSSGTVPVTMSGGITYSTSHPQFGKTNSRIGANSGALFTLPTTSGKELTVEWWWYPTSLTNAYCGVIPSWGNIEFYNYGVYLQAGGYRLTVNATSDGLTLNTWHHIAITRASSGVTKVYIDGVLRNTQAYTQAIAAGQWRWFTGQESYVAYLAGYTGGLRVTIGSTLRYDGSFTTPVSVFQTYAPAPGSTLSGRVLLGTNGAVVQSGNNPLNVKTGILQTLTSKIFSMEDINASNISNILSTTDQFTFTVDGVVADAGTTGGTDYTSRFDTIDGEVLAVKAQTDKLNFTPNAVSVDSILDPYFSDVILLMDNEGDNDSTVFTDLTATATLTNYGTPKISTSFKKFGVSSAYFDGVSRVDVSVINMSSFSHWTIDMWVYMPATGAGSQTLIGSWNVTSTLSWRIGLSSTGVPFIEVSNTGVYEVANSVLAASAITLAEWHMITMTKNGSIYKLYVDGVAVITLNGPASIYNSGAGINIGARDDLSQPFTGYIDSIRITKNVVRQVLDFIVPITDFPGTTSVSPELSYYVSTNATGGGGGDCDLTPVTSSLATLSNDVGTVSSNVNLIKSKTDQLAFTSGNVNSHPDNTSDTTAIKAKTDQLNFISGEVVSTVDLTDIESDLLAVKTKTDQLSFSAGKVITDASVVDYTSQLSAITSTVNAINDAVNLIDTVTSKIAFETVYSEGDPNLAQVIFKAEFNGTNGSTVINADTGQTGTNQGSPSLSTAYTRTGTSSVALSGSMVSYGNISSLNFGANDFTIEFSVNFSSIASSAGDYAGVVGKKASNGDFSWICYVTEGKMNFLTSGTNAISTAHPTVLSTGVWYDVAISRTGDILKFYINGVLSQVSCTGLNITTTTAPFLIGRLSYDISSYYMFGYLDRLRVTVGTGRYNSVAPISPPVSEYPTTLNGVAQSYKVVANCNSGTTIPADLTDRLTDIRNRINAIHFIVKDE